MSKIVETTKTAQELYDKMLELYPHRINPGWALVAAVYWYRSCRIGIKPAWELRRVFCRA